MSDNERSGPADDELSLPKGMLSAIFMIHGGSWTNAWANLVATVQKLINEMMPNEIVCAKDTRDLLIDACVGKW